MTNTVIVIGGSIPSEEKNAYVDYLEQKHQRKLKELVIEVDGEDVNLRYQFQEVPFERIRRITGYLTGDTKTWNPAKVAEEKDRVKHDAGLERI